MKINSIVLASFALLFGCAISPANNSQPAAPISIPSLALRIDAVSGQAEVLITVKSNASAPLKTVRVFLAFYDAEQARINAVDEPVEVLGPINPSQIIGPLEKIPTASNGAACVEVVRVEAVALDYSTRIVRGPEAANVVASGNRSVCSFKRSS